MFETLEPIIFHPTAMTIYQVMIGIALTVVIVSLLDRYISTKISNKNHRYTAKKLITSAWYIIGIIVVIIWFSSRLTGFAVAFGVAGAGIAFALQEVIASFAGWLGIMFGDFYKAGDRVQLWGIKWDVIDIGILRTTIMEMGERVAWDQYNGRIVRVANSFVFKEPVYNYSGDFPFLWDEMQISIYYGSDYELAKQIMLDAAHTVTDAYISQIQRNRDHLVRQYLLEDARLEPKVTISIGEKWVVCTLRYIVHHNQRRSINDTIYMKIITAIEKTDGKVKFATWYLTAI